MPIGRKIGRNICFFIIITADLTVFVEVESGGRERETLDLINSLPALIWKEGLINVH